MNILKFLESFTNDNLMNTNSSRRDSFSQFGYIGKNMTLASIPFRLVALSSKVAAA